MIMYCKLFASLYQGTLRGRGDEILVFTNLLAHADQHGICDKHWRAIADETGLTVEAVKTAIVGLEAPDPESRSPEMDGCRIVRMDGHRAWGWQIVNYGKYRAIRNEDDRREANRLAQERGRNKNKPPSATVSHSKPPSAHTEAEAEAEADLKADATSDTTRASKADDSFDAFWDIVHRKVGKEAARKAFTAAAKRLRFVGSPAPQSYLIERMMTFAASPAATPTDHTPIHPATWLNQGRYDDDQSTWQTEQQTTKRAARLTR